MLFSLALNFLHMLSNTLGNRYRDCVAVTWKQELIKLPAAIPQVQSLAEHSQNKTVKGLHLEKGAWITLLQPAAPKSSKKNVQRFHAHILEHAPYVQAQEGILWDHGRDYSKKFFKKNYLWIPAKEHGTLFFLIFVAHPQNFGLFAFPTFPFFAWHGGISPRSQEGELGCFSLIAALCTSLTTARQSTRDVKSFWF